MSTIAQAKQPAPRPQLEARDVAGAQAIMALALKHSNATYTTCQGAVAVPQVSAPHLTACDHL